MIDEALIEGYAYETAFWMAGVFAPEYPLEQLGEVSMSVCANLRALACFRLLKDARPNAFFHNLIRSALVRLHYLERCVSENRLDDHFRGSGRYASVCDAVAATDFALARRIIAVSPSEFMAGHEYEDDYCYAQLLHRLITDQPSDSQMYLSRLARYLDGQETGRYLVMEAFLRRDQEAFDRGFDQLLIDRGNEIEKEVARGQIESPHIIMARRIFIEGIALLRLAERAGFKTEDEYMFCPSLARVPMTEAFPGE